VVKEFAVYTAARLGLFVVAYAAVVGVYLLVSDGGQIPLFWPFLLAVVISAIASAVLLRAQRERFASAVQRRAARMSARIEQSRSKEDEPDS
jgi:mannitol-specific phosphotransferase system IIBC component